MTFRAGSTCSKTGGEILEVKTFFIHPRFDSIELDYDVAVVELKKPITFSKTMKPISLTDSEPVKGDVVKVSGWGVLQVLFFFFFF